MGFSDSSFAALDIRTEDGLGWQRLLGIAVVLTAIAAAVGLVIAGA